MSSFNQGVPGVATLINSSATILSGNAASANALTVRQFGGGNVFSAQTTTGSTALFVNAAGNVGIGTTNPSAGGLNSLAGALLDVYASGTGVSSNVNISAGCDGTASGSNKASLIFNIKGAGGGIVNGGITHQLLGSDYSFNIQPQTLGTSVMVVKGNGTVGIGTTNPGYTLQVNGSIGMVGGTTIPVTLPATGSQTSYGITLAASGTWYTIISDARINATITGAIGQSDLTSTIFIATLYASGGANASMTLVTGSATNIRVSGTALQFNAVSALYGLTCNFTLLRHN